MSKFPSKILYEFPFAFPAKERERARVVNGKPVIYSPASTKKAYKEIREHIMQNYPLYEKQKITTPMNCAMEIGLYPKNDNADLDNHLKMLDALNRDASRKANSGFKGLWKDDKLIKSFDGTRIKYVDSPAKEYTIITLSPYDPGGDE